MGATRVIFQSGKTPFYIDELYMRVNGYKVKLAAFFAKFLGILSGPHAFPFLGALSTLGLEV